MKKLNNKGLTAIEVLVCFAIISVIVISMFSMVTNYKNKESLESYKRDITTYKNTVTKTIYSDIIDNRGITSFTLTQTDGQNDSESSEYFFQYQIDLVYKTTKKATIVIYNDTKCYKETAGEGLECTDDIVDNIDSKESTYYISFKDSKGVTDKFPLPKIYGLKYNDIVAKEMNGIITIKVGLWHNELGTKYDVLNIITPNVTTYPGMLG